MAEQTPDKTREAIVARLRSLIEWVSERDHGKAIELDEVVHELEVHVGAEALVRQAQLKGMSVEDGAALLELESPRELVIPWVWAARELLGDAPNYSETRIDFPTAAASMEVKAAYEVERFVLTVQRAGKLTPHEARQQAEAERDELRTREAVVRPVLDAAAEAADRWDNMPQAPTWDHYPDLALALLGLAAASRSARGLGLTRAQEEALAALTAPAEPSGVGQPAGDTTQPAEVDEDDIDNLRDALFLVERKHERSSNVHDVIESLVAAVVDAGWRPAQAEPGIAQTVSAVTLDDLCMTAEQIIDGVHDEATARDRLGRLAAANTRIPAHQFVPVPVAWVRALAEAGAPAQSDYAVAFRASQLMQQHYLDPNYHDIRNGDGCICGGWTSCEMGPGWDDHLAEVLAGAGLLRAALAGAADTDREPS